jgi:hypothetical protein
VFHSVILLFVVFFVTGAQAHEQATDLTNTGSVRVCQLERAKYGYRIDLANLILSKTSTQYGSSTLHPYRKEELTASQNRCIELLKTKRVDLLYLPPKPALLEHFDYIPFDIHAGMLGYRVFLIRKQDESKFSKVKTLEDLRSFTGGFGSQWGDFKIFGLNDLPVVGAANTGVLMKMLRHGRFHYFHRGLHEAWAELEAQPDLSEEIMVEPNLALRYPFQVFFWFHKDSQHLKERFKTGILLAIQDGSFKTLFKQYFDPIVTKAKLNERNIIDISYPIPDEVKVWLGESAIEPFWLKEDY